MSEWKQHPLRRHAKSQGRFDAELTEETPKEDEYQVTSFQIFETTTRDGERVMLDSDSGGAFMMGTLDGFEQARSVVDAILDVIAPHYEYDLEEKRDIPQDFKWVYLDGVKQKLVQACTTGNNGCVRRVRLDERGQIVRQAGRIVTEVLEGNVELRKENE